VKTYLISFAVGLLVGVIYSFLDVRAPAPPVIALVGLLVILLGEQVLPLARKLLRGNPVTVAWVKREREPHIPGTLPVGPIWTL
jgi:XapX domain-containing protein